MNLDQQYDAAIYSDEIYTLAEKMWNALNEVNFDPMHPKFSDFKDPVKDKIIEYATDMILGFPSCNEPNA